MSDKTPTTDKSARNASVSAALGLDELLQVTGPRAWIVLIALVVFVVSALIWSIVGTIPSIIDGQALLMRVAQQQVAAPVDGVVASITVDLGSQVKIGDTVGSLVDPNGAQTDLKAVITGTVTGINAVPGLKVTKGAIVMTIEDLTTPLIAVAYVPIESGKQIAPGMEVQLAPTVADADVYGYLTGKVHDISAYPTSGKSIANTLGVSLGDTNASLRSRALLQMIIDLNADPSTPSGYQWTSSKGPKFQLSSGTLADARILASEQHPITIFLPIGSR